jgi:hypothetical protein
MKLILKDVSIVALAQMKRLLKASLGKFIYITFDSELLRKSSGVSSLE